MTTIHQLLPGDLYNVAVGAREFYEEMGLPGEFKFNHFEATWSTLMNFNLGTIFAAFDEGHCVAGIGCICFPCPNTGANVVTEAFWYVRKSHRRGTTAVKLFKEFEKWAVQRKANRIIMGALTNSPEGVIKLLKRAGYNPLETHYMRIL